MNTLSEKLKQPMGEYGYSPSFFNLPNDTDALQKLLDENRHISIHNAFENQVKELIKTRHPKGITEEKLKDSYNAYLKGSPEEESGTWVYFPWNQRLVHILEEDDFIELRTNRNQYKITSEERDRLRAKTIGIIGLSVGQSIALTLAMERGCGKLRLSDFDELELSNLNRIRTPLHNLGLPKVITTAREITEIDPYIEISLYPEGISDENLESFLTKPEPIDLLVDECDSMDVKVLARERARALGIPVIMDTSDRGMLDIERFDLEPDRPLFHGLAGDLDTKEMAKLTNVEKLPYILKILGADDLSSRAKASALEVNETLQTWPQLASSVLLGGAAAADISRRILLDKVKQSGRYFLDIESLVPSVEDVEEEIRTDRPPAMTRSMAEKIIPNSFQKSAVKTVDGKIIKKLISSASLAPSGGNCQPWKWWVQGDRFHLLHDRSRSKSLLDFAHTGSYYAFGAVIENFVLEANAQGYGVNISLFPNEEEKDHIASLRLTSPNDPSADQKFRAELYKAIPIRVTNRKNEGRKELDPVVYNELDAIKTAFPDFELLWLKDPSELNVVAEVASEVERLRILDKQGHYDTLKEIRWTEEEVIRTRDGLDIKTLELNKAAEVGVALSKDWSALRHLREWDLGGALKNSMQQTVQNASCVGLLTAKLPFTPETFIEGGRLGQQLWMAANIKGVSFQPISPSTFFFNRMIYGKKIDMNTFMRERLSTVYRKFVSVFGLEDGRSSDEPLIFMFRLNKASGPSARALRLPVEEIWLNNNF